MVQGIYGNREHGRRLKSTPFAFHVKAFKKKYWQEFVLTGGCFHCATIARDIDGVRFAGYARMADDKSEKIFLGRQRLIQNCVHGRNILLPLGHRQSGKRTIGRLRRQ